MLVDGKLKSVTFNWNSDNEIVSIKEISKDDWLLSLKIDNTLRGYIRLEKDIVDQDGSTPMPEDETEFEYTIELRNSTDPGPFTVEGSHVPWYGVDGLFYHTIDGEGNYRYYQAYPNGEGHVSLTDDHGNTFDATCSGMFAEDVGPAEITYTESGETKTIQLYGNEMTHDSDNYVRVTMKINQNQGIPEPRLSRFRDSLDIWSVVPNKRKRDHFLDKKCIITIKILIIRIFVEKIPTCMVYCGSAWRGKKMKVSYKKLWILCAQREITPAELRKKTGLASATFTKLRRNQEVNLGVLLRVAEVLSCDAQDIMTFLPDDQILPEVETDDVW